MFWIRAMKILEFLKMMMEMMMMMMMMMEKITELRSS
jgi:hypothetical protein